MTWNEILELIERARGGDRQAYGELVERFFPAVHAVALARLRDPHEAAELTQDVFVHAMGKITQLRDPHCFVGWLRQIAVRMAINRLTRRGPIQGAEPEFLQNAPDKDAGPLEDMVRGEERQGVWSGLDKLKELDRRTLVAFYFRGQTLEQMAVDFEAPVGTIKRRLHVARKRLKLELERPGRRRRKAARA
jgi:RNA polymerase sigma-70 factor (ECF subfamily)